MTKRAWLLVSLPATALLMAAANGAWLKKVPPADHIMVNPFCGQPDAVAAGSNLYKNNCAQCHGADGNGRGGRPPVHSARIAGASDGDLYWLLKNGQQFRGMPSWARLPEGQRWQIVAYVGSSRRGEIGSPTHLARRTTPGRPWRGSCRLRHRAHCPRRQSRRPAPRRSPSGHRPCTCRACRRG